MRSGAHFRSLKFVNSQLTRTSCRCTKAKGQDYKLTRSYALVMLLTLRAHATTVAATWPHARKLRLTV